MNKIHIAYKKYNVYFIRKSLVQGGLSRRCGNAALALFIQYVTIILLAVEIYEQNKEHIISLETSETE